MSARVDLSVVVPAYEAERKIGPCLEIVGTYLADAGIRAEIVVVDDGSRDGTAAVAAAAARDIPGVRLLRNTRNRGKGYSVRRGVLSAVGPLILFTDDDLSAPIEEFEKLARTVEAGCDCAFGSRAAAGAELVRHQPLIREQLGRVGNRLVQEICPTLKGFRDTQCGFKLYRREAAHHVFPFQTIDRWGFDFEILHLLRRGGYRVVEVPVRWSHVGESRLRGADYARTLGELVTVRLNDLRGRYAGVTSRGGRGSSAPRLR